jgi:putative methionine-R-sulfoxide reductase with GAF domain
VKSSVQSVSRVRWKTLLWTITFITVVFGCVHLIRGPSWLETIILWTISIIGAIVIIWFAFHQVQKINNKLQLQLEKSQQKSQRQAALAKLSAGFITASSEDGICSEVAQRLKDIQGYENVAIFLLNETTRDMELCASVGGFGYSNSHLISAGIGLSEQPLLDGKLRYSPDVTNDLRNISSLGHGSEVDVPIQFKGKIIGVITVKNPETDAFGDKSGWNAFFTKLSATQIFN